MDTVVVAIDTKGYPSVVGPFETADEAVEFATESDFYFGESTRCIISVLQPIPDHWTRTHC